MILLEWFLDNSLPTLLRRWSAPNTRVQIKLTRDGGQYNQIATQPNTQLPYFRINIPDGTRPLK